MWLSQNGKTNQTDMDLRENNKRVILTPNNITFANSSF